jgi:hypothetical protein
MERIEIRKLTQFQSAAVTQACNSQNLTATLNTNQLNTVQNSPHRDESLNQRLDSKDSAANPEVKFRLMMKKVRASDQIKLQRQLVGKD